MPFTIVLSGTFPSLKANRSHSPFPFSFPEALTSMKPLRVKPSVSSHSTSSSSGTLFQMPFPMYLPMVNRTVP
jgi:hypothetical protein